MIFALPNFKGAVPHQKLYRNYHPHVVARHVAVSLGYTPNSENFEAHTLNFKPIFDPL